jgi:glyceraldehyde 3-phosphate dehydrogenase
MTRGEVVTTRVAINGFGRIGRGFSCAPRCRTPTSSGRHQRPHLTRATNAHLLKYDSTQGSLDVPVALSDDGITVGQDLQGARRARPRRTALEASSTSTWSSSRPADSPRARARPAHLSAGAKKVIISAPPNDVDATFVIGVNEDTYDPATTTSSRTPRAPPTASCRW